MLKEYHTGIAGALNAKIDIADMVLSEDALQHDIMLQALAMNMEKFQE